PSPMVALISADALTPPPTSTAFQAVPPSREAPHCAQMLTAHLCPSGPENLGDVVPGVPVEAGAGHGFGQETLGLAGEAGGQGDGGQVVAGPGAAALGELAKRVAGEVAG